MKTRRTYGWVWALAVLLVVSATVQTAAAAEKWKVYDDDGSWCGDHWSRDADIACEARELTIDADWETITVDACMNGGIKVEGWKRDEIRIRAKMRAWAPDEDEAREILEKIEINTSGETIRASGPKLRGNNRGWAVSYELMVPHSSNLSLETMNGGITIADVEGDIFAETTNGGLHLSQLGGDVRGRTTNGGLTVQLHGKSWSGEGLDAETTNGGVKLLIPESYSARLETGTVNGSIDLDFPLTVQGRLSKKLRATLGDGGPRIRATTTNGGVKIKRG